MRAKFWRSTAVAGLFLFFLALIPRLLSLDVFLTPDEIAWFQRVRDFTLAAWQGNWHALPNPGYPGIPVLWSAAFGIMVRLALPLLSASNPYALLSESLECFPCLLLAVRMPFVFISSAGVVGLYLLARELFDDRVAFLSGLLLALEPFFVANSRVFHSDATVAVCMTLALLAFLVYLERRELLPHLDAGERLSRRTGLFYLILSGVMTGLACSTKLSSLILIPAISFIAAIVYLWTTLRLGRLNLKRAWELLFILAVWSGIATLTFTLIWPAFWVEPLEAVDCVWSWHAEKIAAGHLQFLFGKVSLDPGLPFYPVVFLLRATPLMIFGLPAGLILLKEERKERPVLVCLLAYVALFFLFVSLSRKKQDRYLLPAFPLLDIVVAAGLWNLFKVTSSRFKVSPSWQPGFLAGCLILQAGFSLPHHPYYFTCYDPLFGGGWLAPKVIQTGWGEGLDEVARYLNSREHAQDLEVAVPYRQFIFDYTFVGKGRPMTRRTFFWADLDYVVLYLNQAQRHIPDQEAVDYFRSLKPEYVVRLKGIDYAWIYRKPTSLPPNLVPNRGADRVAFGDEIFFLGYDAFENMVAHTGHLQIDLFWQALRPMDEDYTVHLKLINGAYHVWGQQAGRPAWGSFPTNRWREGEVVGDRREIEIMPGTPPGYYHVSVILYDLHGEQGLEPELLLGPVKIPQQEGLTVDDLDIEHRLEANLGDRIHLLGYNIESGFRPGDGLHLTLFWQALREIDQDYTVFVHLADEQGNLWGQKDNQPVDGFYPTTEWVSGQFVRDQYDLFIAPNAPPGQYRIEVGMYLADSGRRLMVNGRDKVLLANIEVKP